MRRAWALLAAAGVLCAAAGQLELPPRALASGLRLASTLVVAVLTRSGLGSALDVTSLAEGGALAYEAAQPLLPLVASGLLLTFVFGARAMRSSSWRELVLHLAIAFVGGVAASWVVRADDRGDVALWLVAIIVAALLSSVPWLLPRDGARVRALVLLAARANGPLRMRLLRAAAAARRLGRAPSLPPDARRDLDEVLAIATRRIEGRGSRAIEQDLSRAVDRLSRIARAWPQ